MEIVRSHCRILACCRQKLALRPSRLQPDAGKTICCRYVPFGTKCECIPFATNACPSVRGYSTTTRIRPVIYLYYQVTVSHSGNPLVALPGVAGRAGGGQAHRPCGLIAIDAGRSLPTIN